MGYEEFKNETIPPWKRYVLTIAEAAEYYHIGEKKLRSIADDNLNSDFIIMNGNRVLFKRRQFETYLDNATCI
ncbi:MAG: transposase [Eubacterium sp.]|nr:transposase [Eubacterium sp.]